MPKHHRFRLILVLLIGVLLLAACGNDNARDKNVYTLTELEAAIDDRFDEYKWPPGFNISADTIFENLDFPTGSYIEILGEYTYLGTWHTCAWEITLLQAVYSDDQTLVDTSMYQLVEFGQNHSPIESDEHSKEYKRQMYNSAVNGNPADLQFWVSNNCGFLSPYIEISD